MNSASIWVIYFEKASNWHTKDVNSPVSRSLMLESSYEGGKVKDGYMSLPIPLPLKIMKKR